MIRYLRFIGLLSFVAFVPGIFLSGMLAMTVGMNERSSLTEEEVSMTVCASLRRQHCQLKVCWLSSRDVCRKLVAIPRHVAVSDEAVFTDRCEHDARNGIGAPILC